MTNLLRSIGLAVMLGTIVPVLPGCGSDAAGDVENQTASSGKFETFVGEDGQYYFQLLAGNSERILRSEGYTTLANAKKGIASVKKNGVSEDNFDVLTAKNGETYFNVVSADNGQVIGTSETYASKSNATRAMKTVMKILKKATSKAAKTGTPAFESFVGVDGSHYFRLRAGNGGIVLQSEGYSSASKADDGIASVKENGALADSYEVLQGASGQYYFRLVAGNSKVIARGETYSSKSNAEHGAETVQGILETLGGGGNASDAEIKTAIDAAAKGTDYVSESDYPMTYVGAKLDASDTKITEALVREKLASYVDNDPDADKPLKDLFAMTGTFAEWKSDYADCPADQSPGPEECAAMRKLDDVLEANLTDIQIFYFGANGQKGSVDGIAVTIFVVGRTPSGNLAGVRTIAIWT